MQTNDTVRANAKVPTQVLTGVEWRAGRHTWLADAGLLLPASNHSIPHTNQNITEHTKVTARLSAAYNYSLSPGWMFLMGLNYNPSNVKDSSSSKQNFIGTTVGVFNEEKNFRTGAGLFLSQSRTDRNFFGKSPDDKSRLLLYGLVLTASYDY